MNPQARTAVSRTLLLVALGLGTVWAAGQVTGGPPGTGGPDSTVQAPPAAAPSAPAAAPASAPSSAGPAAGAAKVEDLTQAEIDAELAEVEKALGRAKAPNPGAQIAEKPLPADLGVPLPSDI